MSFPLTPIRIALRPSPTGRFSRRDVALSGEIWWTLVATFSVLSLGLFGVAAATAEFPRGNVLALAATLGVISVVLARMRPPEPKSWTVHLVLILVYVSPAVAMCGFAPQGSAVVATAVFVGPLISVWLDDRRQIGAHLAAATVVLFIPSACGLTDTATLVACITLAPASLVLALCCIVVMETAEAQGDTLAGLVERDPLTGVGNRRLLDATLEHELQRHRARGEQFSVLVLDLNGFKALNDRWGHAAGDELLRQVAQVLVSCAGKNDVVVRQGGDEFCVVLPGQGETPAQRFVAQIRSGLAGLDAFGTGVTSGIGSALYPQDGRDAESLLDVADDRLRVEKARLHADAGRSRGDALQRDAAVVHLPVALEGETTLEAHRAASSGVTRAELAGNPVIWRLHGLMYLLYAAIGVGVFLITPELTTDAFPYVVAFGAAVGVAHLLSPSPAVGSVGNHVVISMTYIVPALCLVTCQPGGSVAIASAIFVGPLTAIRLGRRSQVALHIGIAALLFGSLVPSGAVNTATTLAILILIVAMAVLGFVVVLVLEAVEAQSAQLAQLAIRDPLTGLANRRGLETFWRELQADADVAPVPVAVVALDLNGFKALNDEVGHSAGDELLRSTARALEAVAGSGDLVVRLGGDEFCLVLAHAGKQEAADCVARTVAALATVLCNGAPLTSGYGIACSDSVNALRPLLDAADADLIANKSRRRTPAAWIGVA